MPAARVFGFECKLYQKVSTVWTEITVIKNATLSLGYAEAEATTRGSGGVEEVEPSLLQVSIEGQLQWSNDLPECERLWDAFFGRSEIELMALTGESTDTTARGVTGKFKITKFPQKQDLDKLVDHDVTFRPCAGSDLAPAEGTAP